MLTTIIIFIIILGILVFVHEFGHFIVAKKSGMTVEEFGFGFPPRIAGIQKIEGKFKWVWGHKMPDDTSRTVYSINWIPLGGFVRILGENNEQENHPGSFINKGFWPRFLTLFAGVAMNVIFAWALISAGYIVGFNSAVDSPTDIPAHATFSQPQIAILNVVKNLPADKAGIQPNDIITGIDNQKFENVPAIQSYVKAHAGTTVIFHIHRGSQDLNLSVVPNSNPGPNEGPTGVELSLIGKLKYPVFYALIAGAKTAYIGIVNIVEGFYQLFTGQVGLGAVGGPIRIAQFVGQAKQSGFSALLNLTIILSLSLAVLNVLPFPALDGGRILFLFIETIRGKKNNQKIEQTVNTVGFLVLLVLVAIVSINDVIRIIYH